MNVNFFVESFNGENEPTWEFQLENMVSKLIEEPELNDESILNEEEEIFNFVEISKDKKHSSSEINQEEQKDNFETLSSSPTINNTKYQRSNIKFQTFTGKINFKDDFLLKTNCSKPLPHSSSCLNEYVVSDNSFSQNVQNTLQNSNTENKTDILLNKISSHLNQNEHITLEVYQILKGNLVEIIKSHKGSRLFQNYLKKTPYSIISLIYQELQFDLVGIISNLYSNYFFTKFYSCLHKKDRIEIISIISRNFVDLACNNIGAFPIQSIIEQANTKFEKSLITKLISNNIGKLICDPYGCHVIAKIIECFEKKYLNPIFTFIINNLVSLTKEQNGICVMKAFISYLANQNNFQHDLYQQFYSFVLKNFISIIHNQYGNQVIKTIVQLWHTDLICDLLSIIQMNSVELSIGKFSSTITEAYLEKSPLFLELYINNLLQNNLLFEVMRNNFGKYVIQKALKISTGPLRNFLLNYIINYYTCFPDIKFISQWKTILEQYTPFM